MNNNKRKYLESIRLFLLFSKTIFITSIILFISIISLIIVYIGLNHNNGNGNCMLVYVKHLLNGSKGGEVFYFPDSKVRKEGYHVEYSGSANIIMGNYKQYSIGKIKGCNFETEEIKNMTNTNKFYNTVLCEFSTAIIGYLPEQFNEIGE